MPLEAVLLLLVSGLVHAGWNLLVKQSRDKDAFLVLALCGTALLYAPAFAVMVARHGFPAAGVPYLAATCASSVVYFLAMSRAYALGDISLVYPAARGAGLALTPLWAAWLLAEPLSSAGVAGMALVVLGLATSFAGTAIRARARALAWSLVTGVTISVSFNADRMGIRHVHPFVYAYLEYVATGLALLVMLVRKDPRRLRAELRVARFRPWLAGAGMLASYLLVLLAMAMSRLGYVAAVRESSIVFATLLGVLVLGERAGRRRVLGSLLVCAGVVLISVYG